MLFLRRTLVRWILPGTLLAPAALCPTTLALNSNSGDVTVAGSLPYLIVHSSAGDTIDGTTIQGQTITLVHSLPAITHDLTITVSSGAPITITGAGAYQGFSVASGNVSILNFNVTNCLAKGGAGGTGANGGGGGVGGGGGIYVHTGTNVTLSNVQLTTNLAYGGAGGVSMVVAAAGGGGGGFSDGNATGGNGGALGGGGAGGNTNSGVGGATGAAGGNGSATYVPSAGGGGSSGQSGGTATTASGGFAGGVTGTGGGGGGAGAGGGGQSGTSTDGGAGGNGIGTDAAFSGGGGGAGASTFGGGAGTGAGGGGGSGATSGTGGAGGALGGGGGGGLTFGGTGGFGAGGGAGGTTGGASTFGGGTGGSGASTAGGGGCGLGSGAFIQSSATLTVGDPFSPANTAPTYGTGANNGVALGQDFFLRSGGTLIFNPTASNISLANAIASDQVATTFGGLVMSGSQKLTLPSGSTYTGGTTINSGIININDDTALGVSSYGITFNGGTLQFQGNITSARGIALAGAGTIDMQTYSITLNGAITGSGALTVTGSGSGTLKLNAANSYSGGTTINAGTVIATNSSSLGATTSALSISAATLQLNSASPFTFPNPTQLTAAATINTQTSSYTFSGAITGSGSLTKTGPTTLLLSGTNSYSGGTTVNAGTLQGDSKSIQGTLQNNATVVFSQTFNGTYAGVMTGGGTFSKQGTGTLSLTGNSSAFSGPTNVLAGTLDVENSLAGTSLLTVSSGATLSGVGPTGPINISGTLSPGNSAVGTITVQGNATFNGGSTFNVEIAPTSSDLLSATGTATVNGTISLQIDSGFYGISETYTIVSAGAIAGSFTSPVISSNSNFVPSVFYTSTTVGLLVKIVQPFLGFDFSNSNTRAVGENINALNAAGLLTSGLTTIIDDLAGDSTDAINQALDQMHPAPYSTYAEIQTEVGGQLLSMFHRRPAPVCGCERGSRLWVEPFGNWLSEKSLGEQLGFDAEAEGIATGYDNEVADGWVLGVGGAVEEVAFTWNHGRGSGTDHGYYGAVYSDWSFDNVYFGGSALAGFNSDHTSRYIQLGGIAENAVSDSSAIDIMAQLSGAVFYGPPACYLYPFVNLDYFYLNRAAFNEEKAGALNLSVRRQASQTLRSEIGVGMRVQDTNHDETICIAPMLALSWVMETAISRPAYVSTFAGEPIAFSVHGWEHTWQLFTADFGLSVTYKAISATANYTIETSPSDHTPLYDQRASVHIDVRW